MSSGDEIDVEKLDAEIERLTAESEKLNKQAQAMGDEAADVQKGIKSNAGQKKELAQAKKKRA